MQNTIFLPYLLNPNRDTYMTIFLSLQVCIDAGWFEPFLAISISIFNIFKYYFYASVTGLLHFSCGMCEFTGRHNYLQKNDTLGTIEIKLE